MKPNQTPPTVSMPKMNSSRAARRSAASRSRGPSSAAKRVALLRSPVSFQAIARAIRPPSSGKPGIRLKSSTSALIESR